MSRTIFTRNIRIAVFTGILGCCAPRIANAQLYTNVGAFNVVTTLSEDGSTGAGFSLEPPHELFLWSDVGGSSPIIYPPNYDYYGDLAIDLSSNGEYAMANLIDSTGAQVHFARYHVPTHTWQVAPLPIGLQICQANAISGDGNMIAGSCFDDAFTTFHAFQWNVSTNTMTDLHFGDPALYSNIFDLNEDGTVAVGFCDSLYVRVGTIWTNGQGHRQYLGPDGPAHQIWNVSQDGQHWLIDSLICETGSHVIVHPQPQYEGYITQNLGINGDGSATVGRYYSFDPLLPYNGIGYIYAPSLGGYVNMDDFLGAHGVDTTGISVASPNAISKNGNAVGGLLSNGDGFVAKYSGFHTGIGTSHELRIGIYPVPAITQLNIRTSGPIDRAEVVDLSGRTVATFNRVVGGAIDVSALTNGMYILHVSTGPDHGTAQFSVMR